MNANGWSAVHDLQQIQALQLQVHQLKTQVQTLQGSQAPQTQPSLMKDLQVLKPETFEGGSTDKFKTWVNVTNSFSLPSHSPHTYLTSPSFLTPTLNSDPDLPLSSPYPP